MGDRMHELVFGKNYEVDADGKPIEKGHGSRHAIANHKPAEWPQDGSARAAVFGHGATIDPATGKPAEGGIKMNSAQIIAKRNQPDKTE